LSGRRRKDGGGMRGYLCAGYSSRQQKERAKGKFVMHR
jgi:hypothetical protein